MQIVLPSLSSAEFNTQGTFSWSLHTLSLIFTTLLSTTFLPLQNRSWLSILNIFILTLLACICESECKEIYKVQPSSDSGRKINWLEYLNLNGHRSPIIQHSSVDLPNGCCSKWCHIKLWEFVTPIGPQLLHKHFLWEEKDCLPLKHNIETVQHLVVLQLAKCTIMCIHWALKCYNIHVGHHS